MDTQQKELAYKMADAFDKTETCDEAIKMVSNNVNDTKFDNSLHVMWLAIYAYIESSDSTGVRISQVDFVYLLSQLDYLRILLREDNFKSYTRQGIEKSVLVLQREMEKYIDQSIQQDTEDENK